MPNTGNCKCQLKQAINYLVELQMLSSLVVIRALYARLTHSQYMYNICGSCASVRVRNIGLRVTGASYLWPPNWTLCRMNWATQSGYWTKHNPNQFIMKVSNPRGTHGAQWHEEADQEVNGPAPNLNLLSVPFQVRSSCSHSSSPSLLVQVQLVTSSVEWSPGTVINTWCIHHCNTRVVKLSNPLQLP